MNYKDYLKTEHWKILKTNYHLSVLPQKCLVCGNEKFELHHRSYVRLGKELLLDLIPLCRNCHYKIHEYLKKENKTKLAATHIIIRKVFSWSKNKTRIKFRPFSLVKKGFRWIPQERPSLR